MEGKVFYVWFDAPIEYIAATAEWARRQRPRRGRLAALVARGRGRGGRALRAVHGQGQRALPHPLLPGHHPRRQLRRAEPWKLVDYIKSFNYLNYEGGKFSTSQGRGVFMDQALEILPADYWRWWLMSNVPEGSDSNFTWESFQAGVNKDLADVLGNFVSRVTKFAAARFGETVPAGGAYGPAEARRHRRARRPPRRLRGSTWKRSSCARPRRSSAPSGWPATSTCSPPPPGPRSRPTPSAPPPSPASAST